MAKTGAMRRKARKAARAAITAESAARALYLTVQRHKRAVREIAAQHARTRSKSTAPPSWNHPGELFALDGLTAREAREACRAEAFAFAAGIRRDSYLYAGTNPALVPLSKVLRGR